MLLTYEDYILLRLLQTDPTITYVKLASYLNVSPHTVKRKVADLTKKGLYKGYYALYEPESLGLTHFFVFLFLDSVEKYEPLEQALDFQPYTVHRSRFFSPSLGVFAQFDYPSQEPKLLKEFFSKLVDEDIVSNYTLFRSIGVRKKFPLDLDRVSITDLSWSYDWQILKNQILANNNRTVLPKVRKSVLNQIKPLDLKILRFITYNANVSQREISKKLKENRTTIWRRIHFLEENVLSGYNAKINRQIFNLTSNKLLILSFPNSTLLNQVFSAFTNHKFRPPFRYHIEISENDNKKKQIIIYITLTPYHESQLVYTLAHYADYKLYSLDVFGNHSVRYAFYDGNFNSKKNYWKLDYEYVVQQPLERLRRASKEI